MHGTYMGAQDLLLLCHGATTARCFSLAGSGRHSLGQQRQAAHGGVQHHRGKSRASLVIVASSPQPQPLAVPPQRRVGAGEQLRPLLEALLVPQRRRETLEGEEGLSALLEAAQLSPWKRTKRT